MNAERSLEMIVVITMHRADEANIIHAFTHIRKQIAELRATLPAGFEVQNGKLFYEGIDLMSLIQRPVNNRGRIEMPSTPLYVRRLSALRGNYEQLEHWFENL